MTHRYPRSRDVAAILTDLVLIGVAIGLLVVRPHGALWFALGVGIPSSLAIGFVTLHFPRAVEVDDAGITFSGYGRAHRYEWSAVDVCVRRFLVGDRVLVRLTPARPWRGRYWILDAIDGYRDLLAALESHRKT